MYLEEEVILQTLQTLSRLFPQHKLDCDLMNRKFFEKYGKSVHEKLSGIGASFKFIADDPEKIFLESEYRRAGKISIVEKTVDFGLIKIPKIFLKRYYATWLTEAQFILLRRVRFGG